MEPTSYLLALFISYIGLYIGAGLYFFTKEEAKPGEKWFHLMQGATLSLAVFLAIGGIAGIITSVILFILLFFIRPLLIGTYIILAILFFISAKQQITLAIVAITIFLYGLPTGTLHMHKEKGKTKEKWMTLFKQTCIYLIIGGILGIILVL